MGDDKLLMAELIELCSRETIVSALLHHKNEHSKTCHCMCSGNDETLKRVLYRRIICPNTCKDVANEIRGLLESSLKKTKSIPIQEEEKKEDVVHLLYTFVEVFRLMTVVTNDILSIAGCKDKNALFDALTSSAPPTHRIKLAAQVAEKFLLNKK